MRLSRRVDGSACGALLSTTRSAAAPQQTTARRSLYNGTLRSSRNWDKEARGSFFCPQSSVWLLSTFLPTAAPRARAQRSWSRHALPAYSTAAAAAAAAVDPITQEPVAVPKQDKEQLMGFVGRQDPGDVDEYLRFHSDPYQRGYAQPEEPELRISDKRVDWQSPIGDELLSLRDDRQEILTKLCADIRLRHRRPHKGSLKNMYDTYLKLPEPRMLHIPHQWRFLLMKVMGTPHQRDTDDMLRYFALLGDVKNAGLTIRRTQWNYALAFVQKSKNWVTSKDNESALQLWREMEQHAGVKGNNVTFNILFDVASKTGNFVLADMIYKEMDARGIRPNRYFHVSLIYYFGLKQDSDGMLAAYAEMVEAGELVDTVVLNCLISGFLRCGQEDAAEHVYERMKDGRAQDATAPERDYATSKVITQVLMMFARVGRKHPSLKQVLQKSVPLTPDLQTYKLLIDHHAVRIGDLAKVTKYLDEMKLLDIPIHATIFLSLLKGFFHYGGVPGTAWSKQRLDKVLSALYFARDQRVKDFRIRRWLVLWGLRAMKRCSDDNDEVERTFNELAIRWDIPLDAQQFMEAVLEKILSDEDMKSPRGNWAGTMQMVKRDGTRL